MRFLLLLLLCSCAPNKTIISWHDGKVVEILGSDDQLVEVQLSSGTAGTVKIDSRKSSLVRDMIQFLLIKMSSDSTEKR